MTLSSIKTYLSRVPTSEHDQLLAQGPGRYRHPQKEVRPAKVGVGQSAQAYNITNRKTRNGFNEYAALVWKYVCQFSPLQSKRRILLYNLTQQYCSLGGWVSRMTCYKLRGHRLKRRSLSWPSDWICLVGPATVHGLANSSSSCKFSNSSRWRIKMKK